MCLPFNCEKCNKRVYKKGRRTKYCSKCALELRINGGRNGKYRRRT